MTTSPPAPHRGQIKDEAAAHIRELIVSGQVKPGTHLRLAPLAEQIGASITPVREALLLLARDGWVVQEPNRGFRTAEITRRDVEDAYLVQSMVAGELAARAAAAADDATVENLWALDAEMKAWSGDPGFLETTNYRLHGMVYDLADSARLTWFVEAASRFVPRRFWGTIPGWVEHNRTGHEPIIRALAARDPEGARIAMQKHIAAARDLLIDHLDAVEFWSGEGGESALEPVAAASAPWPSG